MKCNDYFLYKTLFVPGNTDAEILWVTISPHPNIQWQVGVCYRLEDQAHMLQQINNSIYTIENSNCLLLGDFNFRKIDWSKGEENSQVEKSFVDALNDNFLVLMVDKSTRGNNILDLVCISDPSCTDKPENNITIKNNLLKS